MRFENVAIASVAHTLPEEVVTSDQLEERLSPLYERLRLPPGRLELMSGIRERRFFPPGTRPGDISIRSAERAVAESGLPREAFGACLHGSVCRDCLEPATACRVHHALGLASSCVVQDVSNACLGVLSGALQIASMIELGQIQAGVVVGTECGRQLVENTVAKLNTDESFTRDSVKNSFASLTIGSASAAIALCHRDLAPGRAKLVAATVLAETEHHDLCQSEGLSQVMQTDSERLMRAGVAAGARNFEALLGVTGWNRDEIDRTFCHQVGGAHRKMMLGELGLPLDRDYATLEWLGNTGAAALPSALSLGVEAGAMKGGDRVALLGIGSGVNCLMMGVEWNA
ncbi:3-oxoacyl-[acyl-carrier-protein] synthase 3 [Planctomycetes bacterium MalM25]|nr:3-oxoacyl-[acyl-carrier-protein] synthase 3 [Planctomycetes bacterium MalM25]